MNKRSNKWLLVLILLAVGGVLWMLRQPTTDMPAFRSTRAPVAHQDQPKATDADFGGYWALNGKPIPIRKPKAPMATLTARPSADAANPFTGGGVAWTPDSGGNLYSRVNDATTQPTTPSLSSYIQGAYVGADDVPTDCHLTLDTSALSAGDTITDVTVWIYSANSSGVPAPGTYLGLVSGGTELGGGTTFSGTSAGWHSNTYTGLSIAGNTTLAIYLGSQGDPTAVPTPLDNTATVYTAYAVITYTAGGGGGGGGPTTAQKGTGFFAFPP